MTLTLEQLRDEIARVSYRDGWTFEVRRTRWEGPVLVVRTRQPDSRADDEDVDLGIVSHIPPMPTSGDFRLWLLWRVLRIASHEAREFLRYDGVPIDDPHSEAAA